MPVPLMDRGKDGVLGKSESKRSPVGARLALAVLAAGLVEASACCGGAEATRPEEPDASSSTDLAGHPLIILTVDRFSPERTLMDSISAICAGEAVGTVLAPHGGPAPDIAATLARECMEAGMLVLMSGPVPVADTVAEGVEYMRVDFPDPGSGEVEPLLEPASLQSELDASADLDLSGAGDRHRFLAMLFLKYVPDLVAVDAGAGTGPELAEVTGIWLDALEASSFNMMVISPQVPGESYRGWAILLGTDVHPPSNGVTGLTPPGLLSTARILAGLPWTGDPEWGSPAISVLEQSLVFGRVPE